MKKIIEFKNVTFSYEKEKTILENISFEVTENSYTLIIGENGSGKSTITKLLLGIEMVDDGEIIIEDKVLNKNTINELRNNLGIVFQNPDNQFVANTIKDDIIFGLENNNIDPKEMDNIINDVANIVKIEHLLDKDPSYLSGGEKQKSALAAILALKPKIIILDESTNMLDLQSQNEFRQLILQLKEEGITIISISHDPNETLLADKIILLEDKKISFQGTKKDFFNSQSSFKYSPNHIKLQKQLGWNEIELNEKKLIEKLKGDYHANIN